MKTQTLTCAPSLLAVLLAATAAHAQVIQPVPVAPEPLPPVPGLNCTAESQNVSGFMNDDGSFFVFNVPANQGQLRLRATCTDAFGNTLTGQSELVVPVAGQRTDVGNVDFGSAVPIAAQLSIAPLASTIVGVGSTLQLAVGSQFADFTTGDVTAASTGTSYRSSNPDVVTVSPDGLVSAVSTGTAIVSALNEGAMGLMTVTVLSASIADFSVSPASVSLIQNPVYDTGSATLIVTGSLNDGSSADLTSSMSGTTYVSDNPSVVVVGPSGSLSALQPGAATITITSAQTGTSKQVPVLVTGFSPQTLSAYDTPGFAYNVELDGNLAFVADGSAGLQVIDTTGGTTVSKLAFTGSSVLDVKIRGGLAAVALGATGLGLADVSDPVKPTVITTITTPSATVDVWLSGDRLYAATATDLLVYDVSTPSAPTLVGSMATAFAVNAVAADTARGFAVALTNQPALEVIQTGGPVPWPSVTVPLSAATNQADDVVVLGTSAYVANGRAGLVEIDLANLTAPFVKSTSILDFNALGVAVRSSENGTLVGAADNLFVNAIPFFNTSLVNTYNLDFSAFAGAIKPDANSTGIALGDGFGVVTVGADGIQVFRTTQLTDNAGIAPTVSISQPVAGAAFTSGDFLYVQASATDDVSVGFVDFLVDGVVVATDSVAPFGASFPAGAPCTTSSITAQATDVGGNVGPSIPVAFDVLCADGQPCATDNQCASGLCSGGTCQACAPGVVFQSCSALKTACPANASGTYTIDPDGAGPGAPIGTYCEMGLGGGGWTLMAKLTNQDTKNWVDAKSSWTSATSYGNTSDLSAGADAKSPAWSSVPVSEFLLTDDQSHSGGLYIETLNGCVGGSTLDQYFTTALANYPNTANQNYYRQCATYNNYLPQWTTDPNWIGQTAASPSLSLKHGYFTIAYTDGGDTQAVFSFYAFEKIWWGPDFKTTATEYEADLGLGESEQNGVAFGLNDGQLQDMGSASSCGFNDATCASFYPQTVFLFAR